MAKHKVRDKIIVKDQNGSQKTFHVDAIYEMDENQYLLLNGGNKDLVFMRLDGDDLITITDESEKNALVDAYNIGFESLPDLEKSEIID